MHLRHLVFIAMFSSGKPQAADNASETLSVYCNVFIYMIKTFSSFCIIIVITYYRLFFSLFFESVFAFIILSGLSQCISVPSSVRLQRLIGKMMVPGCVHVCLRFAVGFGTSGVCTFHVLILMSNLVLNCEVL